MINPIKKTGIYQVIRKNQSPQSINLITIQQVDDTSYEEALALLKRFFCEEGFKSPAIGLEAAFKDMLKDPNGAVFIARLEGKAVAVATVTLSIGLEYGRSAELDDLYVLPESRGIGVARAMIEAVAAWSTSKGVSALLLTVTRAGEEKHDLINYYARQGFNNSGRLILERHIIPSNPAESGRRGK